jgi:transposase
MSKADEEAERMERARRVGLFRYMLIREAADPGLSGRQRGALVRALAAAEHVGPDGRPVRLTRWTLDRWIAEWRAGGFDALVPSPRQCAPRTSAEVLEVAEALKRENPARTAAQVRRILKVQSGWAPDERTLQRHFARQGLGRGAGRGTPAVFGRFEASRPNEIWTGDALHGPRIEGRKTYLFAFVDDYSRAVAGHRWGLAEDTVRLAAALRPALASRGVPERIYVFVLDTPAGSPICPATCRNAAPAGSLTFQAQPEIVRQRLHNPGDRKVCRGRWKSSPGHVRPAGPARRAARPGCLPGGVHRGLSGIPGGSWLQPADHRQRRGDSRAVP